MSDSKLGETLEFEGQELAKSYGGRQVVNNLSLSINKGEIVGLLGPNGAGKTTSFYMMVGLVRADGGNIKLDGKSITNSPLHERALMGIGYLPQEASIFRELSVEENISAVLEGRNIRFRKRKKILESLINDFGLGRIRKSVGRELSGGERRRVEIARTLALEPTFVLLDEPFAGVDPLAVSEIQELIKDLKNKGIGVLITDHNVRETLGIVERAYIMNQGEVLISGKPDDLIENDLAKKFYLGEGFKI
jgi:lipopolysaccharide export system ATP-binding protein